MIHFYLKTQWRKLFRHWRCKYGNDTYLYYFTIFILLFVVSFCERFPFWFQCRFKVVVGVVEYFRCFSLIFLLSACNFVMFFSTVSFCFEFFGSFSQPFPIRSELNSLVFMFELEPGGEMGFTPISDAESVCAAE